jgi:hypothetical protein
MVKNQSYLGKLRARSLYCASAIHTVESDTHKQYGPFAGYWDEWVIQAEEMNDELKENISNTSYFLTELRDFILTLELKKKLSKSEQAYILEVTSLAEGKLNEQQELLKSIDEEIFIHRQLTEKLMMVEAIDSLDDD